MMHGRDSETVIQFREFSRRMSHAERAYRNARHTSRSRELTEQALSAMQAIEAEFELCFRLTRKPDWNRVEARAKGEFA